MRANRIIITRRQELTPASFTPEERHEEMRKLCWIEAWSLTASAVTCRESDTATRWADKALAAFDERFPAPNKKSNTSTN